MMTLDIDDSKSTLFLHKEYPITDYNWTLEFIFTQGDWSNNDVKKLDNALGLFTNDKEKLLSLFNSNVYNSAITVSDINNRRAFIILSKVTSMSQFVNSLVHEMLHLSRHIDKCDNNENLFTVIGDISGDIIKELYSL